jgi:hypothetical protein
LDDHDGIQAQQAQIGEVISRESFSPQVGVDQPEPTKAARPSTVTAEVRNKELMGVAHDDVTHPPTPVHHDANLPSEAPGDLGQPTTQITAEPLLRCDAPLVEGLKLLVLAGLQARCVSVDSRDGAPRSRQSV